MKLDMILAGVGGQGILSISYLICRAALTRGLNFKQAEVHGMAQRGGAVQSHLRISEHVIASDLIPLGGASLILSVEPLEAFRYTQFLNPDGRVISSTVPFINIPNYPDLGQLIQKFDAFPNRILIDSKAIAQAVGNIKTQNLVMLGAASKTMGFSVDEFDPLIEELFARKGEKIVQINKDAIRAGLAAADSYQ